MQGVSWLALICRKTARKNSQIQSLVTPSTNDATTRAKGRLTTHKRAQLTGVAVPQKGRCTSISSTVMLVSCALCIANVACRMCSFLHFSPRQCHAAAQLCTWSAAERKTILNLNSCCLRPASTETMQVTKAFAESTKKAGVQAK